MSFDTENGILVSDPPAEVSNMADKFRVRVKRTSLKLQIRTHTHHFIKIYIIRSFALFSVVKRVHKEIKASVDLVNKSS